MLTGRRAFERGDVSLTLADVMRAEPAWQRLPEGLSPALDTFLKRCLEKDPRQRVRDIGDVRLAMDGAFETPRLTLPSQPIAKSSSWRSPPAIVAIVAVCCVIAGMAVWTLKPVESRPVSRHSYPLPEGLNFRIRGTSPTLVDVSPNGSHIIFNSADGLYIRAIDEFDAHLIPGTEEFLASPTFSPDGQEIAYLRPTGVGVLEVATIAVSGGAGTALGQAAGRPEVR